MKVGTNRARKQDTIGIQEGSQGIYINAIILPLYKVILEDKYFFFLSLSVLYLV